MERLAELEVKNVMTLEAAINELKFHFNLALSQGLSVTMELWGKTYMGTKRCREHTPTSVHSIG